MYKYLYILCYQILLIQFTRNTFLFRSLPYNPQHIHTHIHCGDEFDEFAQISKNKFFIELSPESVQDSRFSIENYAFLLPLIDLQLADNFIF